MTRSTRGLWLWVFLGLVLLLAWAAFYSQDGRLRKHELSFPELAAHIQAERVKAISIRGQQISGELTDGSRFQSVGPAGDGDYLLRLLDEKKIVPEFERENSGALLAVLTTLVPAVLLLLVLVYFIRQLQNTGGRAMSFGKSRARLQSEGGRKLSFDDVAGCEEAKEELQEIVQFLRDPRRFTRLGGRIPKGVLLMGPPGTGKTLLARAVAGEAGVPFFHISGSDFVEMFVGVGASRVRDLFEQGKKQAPCIIFIDEIDAVGRHRGAGLGGGHDEREQTLNQLLVEMDGFESNDGVILMAATNRPDVLDTALLRPGRFDRRVVVGNPDLKGRLGILQVHTRRTTLHPSVDLEQVARTTSGLSGADLESLVNEAALLAARREGSSIEMADFEAARDKLAMGSERKGLVLPEKERRRTAVHEAGHAIVASLLSGVDPVHKVSIVPRGRALGVTWMMPEEDRLGATQLELEHRLAVFMGGRVAERLVLQEVSTGASDDLQKATRLARAMVAQFGMSAQLGPMTTEGGGELMLGRDMGRLRDHSEDTARQVDDEVKRLLRQADQVATELLQAHRAALERAAARLLEIETLDGEAFRALLQSAAPRPAGSA